MEDRWDRLARTLDEGGVNDVRLDRSYGINGKSVSITLLTETAMVTIRDTWWRKNPDLWTGWQVTVEGRVDSLVKREYPRTKKRSEVLAAVQDALNNLEGK
jgi:hypothetical protein